MPNPQHIHKIGLSVGSDPNCDKFIKLGRKGCDIVETGPVNDENIHQFIERSSSKKRNFILAANLNSDSKPMNEDAAIKTMERTFSLIYDFIDLVTIDISVRNADYSNDVFDAFTKTRMSYEDYRPIVVRLCSNIDKETVDNVLNNCRLYGLDGVISEDWERLLSLTEGRFPIYAEINNDDLPLCTSAFNKGVDAVFVKDSRMIKRLSKIIR